MDGAPVAAWPSAVARAAVMKAHSSTFSMKNVEKAAEQELVTKLVLHASLSPPSATSYPDWNHQHTSSTATCRAAASAAMNAFAPRMISGGCKGRPGGGVQLPHASAAEMGTWAAHRSSKVSNSQVAAGVAGVCSGSGGATG